MGAKGVEPKTISQLEETIGDIFELDEELPD